MKSAYRIIAYLTLASVFGTMLYGYRFDPSASYANYGVNLALYLLFAIPHLIMTTAAFKQRAWGNPAGSLRERQAYILVTTITWLGVFYLHRPVPGPFVLLPQWITFVAILAFILCIVAFFEGATFPFLDGLLGVPGSTMSHSTGGETPLMTGGSYASVRHPMYRAATLAGFFSIFIHPHVGQVFWVAMIIITFVGFIPIEEHRLILARGDAYREYCRQTPYRLFRGIW